MHELTELIKEDMRPALGVTEPGAIAFAVSTAKKYLAESIIPGSDPNDVINAAKIDLIDISMNSGMYKNAFTCGIPNSDHFGNLYSAALGAVAADPTLGLECLSGVTDAADRDAASLVNSGKVKARLSEVSSRIHIVARLEAMHHTATVTILDSHTNISGIEIDGKTVLSNGEQFEKEVESHEHCDENGRNCEPHRSNAVIHGYTLPQIFEYAVSVPFDEISFIKDAYEMNLKLAMLGIKDPKTSYARNLLKKNNGKIISDDEQNTATLLCAAAIEARVLGLDLPAMSITGSGAHGIIATMGLYAVAKIRNLSEEILVRATAISYLVCMYIKEYSGKLSAFCGCAIAAGTGMAAALVFMSGGDASHAALAVNNMASGITGMICDGGNHGCTIKGITAVDAAFRAASFAMDGICIDARHGINGNSPEETMRNMGLIASPGMTETEKTIIQIMEEK